MTNSRADLKSSGPQQATVDVTSRSTEETQGKGSSFLRRMLVVSCTLLLCLFMLEFGLRIIGRYRMGQVDGYLEAGGLSYVLKKNASKTVIWPGFSWNVYTCDRGFRASRPGPRNLSQPYYAVLGSSDAFGNGLDYEKTFVGVLDEKMDTHGIDIVNMAIGGQHLQEQAALFKQFARSTTNHPAGVLIFFNPN